MYKHFLGGTIFAWVVHIDRNNYEIHIGGQGCNRSALNVLNPHEKVEDFIHTVTDYVTPKTELEMDVLRKKLIDIMSEALTI